MNVLAIIQARGGSKGIPGKNIRPLCGKPLLAWTVAAAKAARRVTRVTVNTDDAAIAAAARAAGAEVPFLRPADLATDEAGSLALFMHALDWFRDTEGYVPDAVVQLKPTNPLRTAATIDAAVDLFFAAPPCDSVMTFHETHDHPWKIWRVGESGFMEPFLPASVTGHADAPRMRRQDLPPAYRHDGAANVFAPATVREKRSLNGDRVKALILRDEAEALNIDTLRDFALAELLLRERLAGGTAGV